ncbi:hypothetical protein LINPERPRIM_LOCUS21397 [Linum perenne]
MSIKAQQLKSPAPSSSQPSPSANSDLRRSSTSKPAGESSQPHLKASLIFSTYLVLGFEDGDIEALFGYKKGKNSITELVGPKRVAHESYESSQETDIEEGLEYWRVADLAIPDSGGWDEDVVQAIFVDKDINVILKLQPLCNHEEDRVVWRRTVIIRFDWRTAR